MPLVHGPFTFATQTGADADRFLYTDPVVTNATLPQAANTTRRWCWNIGGTPSNGVGPTSGQGGSGGYLYTEMSNPGEFNDIFYLRFDTALNFFLYDWTMTFYTNQRGDDNNVTGQVQINKNGAGWVNSGASFGGTDDPNKVDDDGSDIWALRTFALAGGDTASTSVLVRVRLTMPSSGTTWNNDYGLDTFTFSGTNIGNPTEIRVKMHDFAGLAYANGTLVRCYNATTGALELSGTVGTKTGADTANPVIPAVQSGEAVFTFNNSDLAQRYCIVGPNVDVYGVITNFITPTQL